jgi:hypothetical protein
MGVDGQLYAPAALPPGKRPGTHRIGGWVGPRAGLDGCEKSRPTGIFFNIFISILQCLLQIMFYKSYFKCIDKEVLVITRPLGGVDGSYCRLVAARQ